MRVNEWPGLGASPHWEAERTPPPRVCVGAWVGEGAWEGGFSFSLLLYHTSLFGSTLLGFQSKPTKINCIF